MNPLGLCTFPACKLSEIVESPEHILLACPAYTETRHKVIALSLKRKSPVSHTIVTRFLLSNSRQTFMQFSYSWSDKCSKSTWWSYIWWYFLLEPNMVLRYAQRTHEETVQVELCLNFYPMVFRFSGSLAKSIIYHHREISTAIIFNTVL